jgi:thiol-disulfide isomerase/thioredoxin
MKQFIGFFLIIFSIQAYSQKAIPDSIREKIIFGYKEPGWSFENFSAGATNGKTYTTDSLKNKISFINFWFEGCHPCIAEFPALNDLYAKYKDNRNFQFLSFTWETNENATRVAEKYQMKYPIICFDMSLIQKLNYGLGYPTTIVVDGRGIIRFIKNGGSLKEADIRRTVGEDFAGEIERLLKE